VLYDCKGAYTLFTSQREREKEGGGEREKERVFIVKRNDGCLGTFSCLVRKELFRINQIYYRRLLFTTHEHYNK
jgi:hypothetical protein